MKELRDLFADKEALQKKRKELKEKALAHREAKEMESAISDIDKIDEQLRSIDLKIEEIQKNNKNREDKKMNNDLLHFNEQMERAEVLQTVEYRTAFFKKLQGRSLTDVEERSITSASGSGGAAIPTKTMDTIIGQLIETAPMLSLVTVLNIPELISIPKENVVNDANWVTEDGDSTNSDDTLTNISMSAHKLIKTIKVTAKLETMSIAAFEAWVIQALTKKMKAAIDKAVLLGTGTNQPKGIDGQAWTNKTNAIEIAASASITYDDLVNVESLVGEDFSANEVWVMNKKTLAEIMKLKDDQKRPIYERALEDGFRGYILGIPVKLDKNVKDSEAYIGDFKAGYVLNFSKPIELASSKEAGFMSGATVYRSLALLDGKATEVKGAICKLVKKTV